MKLSDILEITDDPSQPRWVECPGAPGLAILLRLPDVPGLRGLAMQASYESLENFKKAAEAAGTTHLPVPQVIDPGAVGLKWSHYAVQGWRGLTGQGLKYFLAGVPGLKLKTAAKVEIPFQRDLLEVLLRRSVRFYEFVDQAWRQRQEGDLEVREAEGKNSLSAPDSTPIPNGAPGARKTTKGSRRRSSATSVKDPPGERPTS